MTPGDHIGDLELLEQLGEGGMGEVWRCRSPTRGEVALKLAHPWIAHRPGLKERFVREARLGMTLNHPGLVTVFELIEEPRLALVMELVPGESLAARLQRGVPAPMRAVGLITQLGAAVDQLHEMGVVHRDLKPENVRITPEGRAVVLDLGIAREPKSQQTRTGTGMGTAQYMAPEQYLDAKSVDRRADVYALGVMAFELLTGRLPWADASEFEMLRAKADGELDLSELEPAVAEVLAHALCPRPVDRFANTRAFANALMSAVGAPSQPGVEPEPEPEPAPEPEPEPEPMRPARSIERLGDDLPARSRLPAVLSSAAVVGLLAGCVGLGVGLFGLLAAETLPFTVQVPLASVEGAGSMWPQEFVVLEFDVQDAPSKDLSEDVCGALEQPTAADQPLFDALFEQEVEVGFRAVQVGREGLAVYSPYAQTGWKTLLPLPSALVADEDLEGILIPELYEEAQWWTDHHKAWHQHCGLPSDDRVLLVVDRGAPWATLRQVMYTLGQAGFGDLHFLVQDAAATRRVELLPAVDSRRLMVRQGVRDIVVSHGDREATGPLGAVARLAPQVLDGPLGCAVLVPAPDVPAGDMLALMAELNEAGAPQIVLASRGDEAGEPRSLGPAVPMMLSLGETWPTVSALLPRIGPPGSNPVGECGDPAVEAVEPEGPGILDLLTPSERTPEVPDLWEPQEEPSGREAIDAVVRRHTNQIQYCYQRELVKNQALQGRITVGFLIASDGTVSSASVDESTLNSPAVEDCVVGRFLRMKFPAQEGSTVVSYPFVFSVQ